MLPFGRTSLIHFNCHPFSFSLLVSKQTKGFVLIAPTADPKLSVACCPKITRKEAALRRRRLEAARAFGRSIAMRGGLDLGEGTAEGPLFEPPSGAAMRGASGDCDVTRRSISIAATLGGAGLSAAKKITSNNRKACGTATSNRNRQLLFG